MPVHPDLLSQAGSDNTQGQGWADMATAAQRMFEGRESISNSYGLVSADCNIVN
jgi:hypothetical protein